MNGLSFLLASAPGKLPALEQLELDLAGHEGVLSALYGSVLLLGLLVDLALLLYARTHPLRWRERVSRLCWRPWDLRDGVILVLSLVLLHVAWIAFAPALRPWIEEHGWRETSAYVVLQSALFHWTGLALVIVLLRVRRIPWRSAFGWSARSSLKNALRGMLLLLGTMPLLMFYTLIYHVFLEALHQQPSLQDVTSAIAEESAVPMQVYFAFLAVVLAPLFEEILFRGVALPVLAQRYGVGRAVLGVSLVFALIHGHIPSLVPLFLLSVALCLAYIYTESIITPMVMHSVFNAMTVTVLLSFH